MKGRRIFLLLSVLLFAISVSAEPLAHDHHDHHDHHDEDHREDFCVVCHFVEISSINDSDFSVISDTFNKNFFIEEYSSYFLSHPSLYSTRAPPKI